MESRTACTTRRCAGAERVAATVPLGRMATPHDIGEVAVFLASHAAAYVTGATIEVHGGGEVPAFLTAAKADPPPM